MAPQIANLVPTAIEAARIALKPFGTGGTMLNLHGHLTSPELAASAWPEAARIRLSVAKAELDQNLFRHGHAILPQDGEVTAYVAEKALALVELMDKLIRARYSTPVRKGQSLGAVPSVVPLAQRTELPPSPWR